MVRHGVLNDVTGILLAGGKSRRMGRDKRFLELGGASLLERAVWVMERLFPELFVVLAEPSDELSGFRHQIVRDLIPDCAALGGLYTGLSYATHARVFVVACDMPFLEDKVITAMVQRYPDADIVMAKLTQGLQPMHAVYSKRCIPYLEGMAREGDLKVQHLADCRQLEVRTLSDEDLRPYDERLLSFLNVNTPADLEFARKLLASRPAGGDNRA